MTTSRSFAQKREGRRSYSHPASGVCQKNRISPCRLGDLRVSVLRFAKKKDTPPRHGEHGETFSDRHLQPGDWGCQEKRKPFRTVFSLCLAQFTWLKARCEWDRIVPERI